MMSERILRSVTALATGAIVSTGLIVASRAVPVPLPPIQRVNLRVEFGPGLVAIMISFRLRCVHVEKAQGVVMAPSGGDVSLAF